MRHLEDSKHLFWKCNRVAKAWKKIQSLKDLAALPSHFRTWDQILWGEVSLPNSWNSHVAIVTHHEQSNTASIELHGRSLRVTSFGTLGVRGVNVIFKLKVFM
jgi:ABC-type thiamine transport system substrate-binding protein